MLNILFNAKCLMIQLNKRSIVPDCLLQDEVQSREGSLGEVTSNDSLFLNYIPGVLGKEQFVERFFYPPLNLETMLLIAILSYGMSKNKIHSSQLIIGISEFNRNLRFVF